MKSNYLRVAFLSAAIFAVHPLTGSATSNYDYGSDEYVTIDSGISPDRRYAITTHGEGEYGYDNFHVYLFDVGQRKKIGPLEEIVDTLDTGAGAFRAKWSSDSSSVTIIYRVSRHSPLKAMTYRVARRRAYPTTKTPVNIADDGELQRYWQQGGDKPSPLIFGTPKKPILPSE